MKRASRVSPEGLIQELSRLSHESRDSLAQRWESGTPKEATVDRVLLKEVARAHRCFEALLSGRAASVEAVAALEGIDKSYVSRLLPPAVLSPDIVEAIVRGVQPAHLTAKTLIQRIDLPLGWPAQRQTLGFP